MGLLTLGLTLAVFEAIGELYVVHNFRPEKFKPELYTQWTRWAWKLVHQLGPWIEKSPVNTVIASIGLSFVLGMMFPAMGVAVFLGAIASTCITQPYYAVRRRIKRYKALRVVRRLT